MHYAEGSAMTPLLLKLIMGTVRSAKVLIKPIVQGVADKVDQQFTNGELATHFGWIEQAPKGAATSQAMCSCCGYPDGVSDPRALCAELFDRPNTQAWMVQAKPASLEPLRKVANR